MSREFYPRRSRSRLAPEEVYERPRRRSLVRAEPPVDYVPVVRPEYATAPRRVADPHPVRASYARPIEYEPVEYEPVSRPVQYVAPQRKRPARAAPREYYDYPDYEYDYPDRGYDYVAVPRQKQNMDSRRKVMKPAKPTYVNAPRPVYDEPVELVPVRARPRPRPVPVYEEPVYRPSLAEVPRRRPVRYVDDYPDYYPERPIRRPIKSSRFPEGRSIRKSLTSGKIPVESVIIGDDDDDYERMLD